jgi:hypothetical protein
LDFRFVKETRNPNIEHLSTQQGRRRISLGRDLKQKERRKVSANATEVETAFCKNIV